nr:immunoglobulin heavy chain junction region [Macaca mulatta]MOV39040.1 immunoglobulin heavy chain junction region [Macaca mulatta]MOV39080.1 immunoglobulin heavy chain junction region [Macaca mulatta]MOV39144.1 immunoglobulin heavy chain junction region [Macaca mulatta]MOV39394.1 immunoglobulin heavy chain junction region [Macaca mulatta]
CARECSRGVCFDFW